MGNWTQPLPCVEVVAFSALICHAAVSCSPLVNVEDPTRNPPHLLKDGMSPRPRLDFRPDGPLEWEAIPSSEALSLRAWLELVHLADAGADAAQPVAADF